MTMPTLDNSGKRLTVLLAGEEAAGIQALKLLARRGDRVAAVMATTRQPHHRVATVSAVAREMGYSIWPAESVKNPDFGKWLRSQRVDLILNVHSLHIIHPAVLAAARIGAYNLHPGPLPGYAGLNTISWAIYRGESSYGVSLHEMTPEIDAGPIAYQAQFPLSEDDSAVSLMAKCTVAGIPLLNQLLDAAAVNPESIPRIPQDLSNRRYFAREVPEGGRLSWRHPARQVVNFVRACAYDPFPSPWGYPRARYRGHAVEIAGASRTGFACASPPGTVGSAGAVDSIVACADEWISLHRVRLDGRAVAPASVFEPGSRLGDGSSEPAPAAADSRCGVKTDANSYPAIH